MVDILSWQNESTESRICLKKATSSTGMLSSRRWISKKPSQLVKPSLSRLVTRKAHRNTPEERIPTSWISHSPRNGFAATNECHLGCSCMRDRVYSRMSFRVRSCMYNLFRGLDPNASSKTLHGLLDRQILISAHAARPLRVSHSSS